MAVGYRLGNHRFTVTLEKLAGDSWVNCFRIQDSEFQHLRLTAHAPFSRLSSGGKTGAGKTMAFVATSRGRLSKAYIPHGANQYYGNVNIRALTRAAVHYLTL